MKKILTSFLWLIALEAPHAQAIKNLPIKNLLLVASFTPENFTSLCLISKHNSMQMQKQVSKNIGDSKSAFLDYLKNINTPENREERRVLLEKKGVFTSCSERIEEDPSVLNNSMNCFLHLGRIDPLSHWYKYLGGVQSMAFNSPESQKHSVEGQYYTLQQTFPLFFFPTQVIASLASKYHRNEKIKLEIEGKDEYFHVSMNLCETLNFISYRGLGLVKSPIFLPCVLPNINTLKCTGNIQNLSNLGRFEVCILTLNDAVPITLKNGGFLGIRGAIPHALETSEGTINVIEVLSFYRQQHLNCDARLNVYSMSYLGHEIVYKNNQAPKEAIKNLKKLMNCKTDFFRIRGMGNDFAPYLYGFCHPGGEVLTFMNVEPLALKALMAQCPPNQKIDLYLEEEFRDQLIQMDGKYPGVNPAKKLKQMDFPEFMETRINKVINAYDQFFTGTEENVTTGPLPSVALLVPQDEHQESQVELNKQRANPKTMDDDDIAE